MATIDTHVHIWAGDVSPYPWDHSLGFKPSFLAPCEDLLATMDAAAEVGPSWYSPVVMDSITVTSGHTAGPLPRCVESDGCHPA